MIVVANSDNGHDLSKEHYQDGKEEQEYLQIGNNGVDHGNDVTQALEDTQVEERLDDLLQEDNRHQYLVVEGLRVRRILGDHIDNTAPHVELVTVVLRVFEVVGDTCYVQLSKVVTHWVDDTNCQQDSIETGVSFIVLNIDGIYIDYHDS